MTKVFVPQNRVKNKHAIIIGDDVRHLRLVLRKQIGDRLLIGVAGQTYEGKIIAIDNEQIQVALVTEVTLQVESPISVRLYLGLIKGSKFDLVVQKAVELGVNEIVPFVSRYTVVKLDKHKFDSKQQRWQKIAQAAAKQSQRALIPQVRKPIDFPHVVSELKASGTDSKILMLYEKAAELSLKQLNEESFDTISIIIGPEGGFCRNEVEQVRTIGGSIIKVGDRIMRSETAAIVGISLIQFIWGDLG